MPRGQGEQIRRWIQTVSETSAPLTLDEILGGATSTNGTATDTAGTDGTATDTAADDPAPAVEPPLIDDLDWEQPVRDNRILTVLGAAAAIIVIAAVALFTTGRGDDISTDLDPPADTVVDETTTTVPSTPLEVATAYWVALSDGDREAMRAVIDPAVLDSSDSMPFGRAESFDGMIDWYETSDWTWELDACEEVSSRIRCTAAARNAWSDAIGVPPVTGVFLVEVGPDGVTRVADMAENFLSQWSPLVFGPFSSWVGTNHPDEAQTMFGTPGDVTPEILELYRVNTERFVDAPR